MRQWEDARREGAIYVTHDYVERTGTTYAVLLRVYRLRNSFGCGWSCYVFRGHLRGESVFEDQPITLEEAKAMALLFL